MAAEDIWCHRKTASVSFNISDQYTDYGSLFHEDGVEEGKGTWQIEIDRRGYDLFGLNLCHSSLGDIWVEAITVAFDDETPTDLLFCADGRRHALVRSCDTYGLPGLIDFTSERDLNMTREVYSAEIVVPESLRRISIKITYKTEIDHRNERILSDFERLWRSQEYADVKLSFRDGELTAHKLVLVARVDHFKELFASGMEESRTNTIRINDFWVESFRLVLEFVYTGRIRADYDHQQLLHLFSIADKYGMADLFSYCLVTLRDWIPRLDDPLIVVPKFITLSTTIDAPVIKEVCEAELRVMVNRGQVVEPLILAHLEGFADLKRKCLREMKSDGHRIGSAGDKLTAYPQLMLEIIKYKDANSDDDDDSAYND